MVVFAEVEGTCDHSHMVRKTELRRNTGVCPWQNYPTHRRNRQVQVHGDVPLSYGYCAQDLGCPACAGTLYKPNILLEPGRPTIFVECPHCDPEGYRRRVERLRPQLPRGAGPTSSPAQKAAQAEGGASSFERGPVGFPFAGKRPTTTSPSSDTSFERDKRYK